MNSVLLAVCGLSPQIFTETLYALHREGCFPVHSVLLTTRPGAALAREVLLGETGQINAFLTDYHLPPEANPLAARDILTPFCNGRPIDDITTLEESEAFQALAMQQTWKWTRDNSQRVDFSIAGGRKTMSASLALAAQCYGRAQDRLFHVLAPPHCESNPRFFYPAPADEASERITLALLPFPRLRPHLPISFLRQPCCPQDLLSNLSLVTPYELKIFISQRCLRVNGRSSTLPPALFALFLWFARHKKEFSCSGQCISCHEKGCYTDSAFVLSDSEGLAQLYSMVRASDAAVSSTGILDLNQENFMAYKAKLNRLLRRDLGELAERVVIAAEGLRPGVRYGLSVEQSRIHIDKN